jgi:hypothetical protein
MESTIASALIAAGAGLLTVGITAAVAAAVATKQLRHDREERAKDRALESKRDRLFTGLEFANNAMRSMLRLANADVTIEEAASEFNKAVAGLSASGSVASLEVVRRGRDLVGQCGRIFFLAMAKRRRIELQSREGPHDWVEFADWAITTQVELQVPYARLLAAMRRDLGIEGSSDDEVLNAIAVDMAALNAAATQAAEILQKP